MLSPGAIAALRRRARRRRLLSSRRRRAGRRCWSATRSYEGARRRGQPEAVGRRHGDAAAAAQREGQRATAASFVQSIDGSPADEGGRRPVDWFFYVNGIEAEQGRDVDRVNGGDPSGGIATTGGRAGHRRPSSARFPSRSPRHGGKRLPVRIECRPGTSKACDNVLAQARRDRRARRPGRARPERGEGHPARPRRPLAGAARRPCAGDSSRADGQRRLRADLARRPADLAARRPGRGRAHARRGSGLGRRGEPESRAPGLDRHRDRHGRGRRRRRLAATGVLADKFAVATSERLRRSGCRSDELADAPQPAARRAPRSAAAYCWRWPRARSSSTTRSSSRRSPSIVLACAACAGVGEGARPRADGPAGADHRRGQRARRPRRADRHRPARRRPPLGQIDITLEALVYGALLGLRLLVVVAGARADDGDGRSRRGAALLAPLVVPLGADGGAGDAAGAGARARRRSGWPTPGAAGRSARRRGPLAVVRAVATGALDRAVDVAATLELRGYAHARGGAPRARPCVAATTSRSRPRRRRCVVARGRRLLAGVGRFEAYRDAARRAAAPAQSVAGAASSLVALLPFAERRGIGAMTRSALRARHVHATPAPQRPRCATSR